MGWFVCLLRVDWLVFVQLVGRSFGCFVFRLVDWLVGDFVGCLVVHLVVHLVGRWVGWVSWLFGW